MRGSWSMPFLMTVRSHSSTTRCWPRAWHGGTGQAQGRNRLCARGISFLNINELVAEFAEYAEDNRAEMGFDGRILCVPAQDPADEIATAMLAQLLEQRGCAVVSFPGGAELDQMLHLIGPESGDVVCISALPPYAFGPARTICRRLRSHFPGVPVIVGIWGFAVDPMKAMARFGPHASGPLVRKLRAGHRAHPDRGSGPNAPVIAPLDSAPPACGNADARVTKRKARLKRRPDKPPTTRT